MDAHEQHRHASVLLLAGARRSEESRTASTSRRTQLQVSNDGGKTRDERRAERARRRSRPSGSIRTIPSVGSSATTAASRSRSTAAGTSGIRCNLPIGQFYDVSYDYAVPYNVCSGAQDNGAWCGPSRRRATPINNTYWFTISRRRRLLHRAGSDGPEHRLRRERRTPASSRRISRPASAAASTSRRGTSATAVGGLDRHRARRSAQAGDAGNADEDRRATASQQKKDSVDLQIRFNWDSPYFLSPHNPQVFYFGGNRVLKSLKRGEDLLPDLARPVGEDRSGAGDGASRPSRHGREVHRRRHARPDRRRDVRDGGGAAGVAAQAGLPARRHGRRQRVDDAQRRRRRGTTSRPSSPRSAYRGTRTSCASSQRTSTRSRSTWRSRITAATTSSRTCSRRTTAGKTFRSIVEQPAARRARRISCT